MPDNDKFCPGAYAPGSNKAVEALLRALLAAFPDRLAKRREANNPRTVMVGGRGVKLAPGSRVTQADLFLCLDVEGSGSEAVVRMASAVERSWLPTRADVDTDVFFDEAIRTHSSPTASLLGRFNSGRIPAPLPEDDRSADAGQCRDDALGRVRPKDYSPVRFLARVRTLVTGCRS